MTNGSNVPLVEPTPIPCIFVSGISVLISTPIVRFVGYVELPPLAGEVEVRRIVVRFVLTVEAARALRDDLAKALKRPGH